MQRRKSQVGERDPAALIHDHTGWPVPGSNIALGGYTPTPRLGRRVSSIELSALFAYPPGDTGDNGGCFGSRRARLQGCNL
jgi:hypothetical protein